MYPQGEKRLIDGKPYLKGNPNRGLVTGPIGRRGIKANIHTAAVHSIYRPVC